MDVTFFEQYPYYSKPTIQGENVGNEYQLWNSITTQSPKNPIPKIQESESMSQINTLNNLNGPSSSLLIDPKFSVPNNDLLVYSRRKITQ